MNRVSIPKGAQPTSAPGMKAAVPAVSKGVAPSHAGKFSKALTHHAAIGVALKAGDHAKARHHTGHMMLAINTAAKSATGPTLPSTPPDEIQTTMAASGDDEGPTSPTLPAKKPNPFNRGAFGAMKKGMNNTLQSTGA